MITILFPFSLVVLTEMVLRTIGYGPDLSLFKTIDVVGRTYHVMNPEVKNRYFTQSSFNPSTSHDLFLVPKPMGTFRVFCLGGSTMVGYPYWYNGAPSTFLRDRLKRLFPSRNVEIINVGMTAVNSFTVLDMAHDLVRYEPDLFIVYDGHNEFYGALGVASHEGVGGFRWITRLYLNLIHYRTFLLFRDIMGRIMEFFGSSGDQELTGTMMEYLARGKNVPYGSPLYLRGLATFKDNLHQLRDLCSENNIPLILSTQVSNLRTFSPFVSGDPPGKIAEERSRFNQRLTRGLNLYSEGEFRKALDTLRQIEGEDSLRADTQYWIARCLDTLGEKESALSAFVKARDYDQLRFRTSSDFNNVIREMSDGNMVEVADVERAFARYSQSSLIDSGLIFEHLHPRARGYFIMAKEFQTTMQNMGLLLPPEQWSFADTLDEEELWDARPITELDDITALRRTMVLTSGWPFHLKKRELMPVSPEDVLGVIADKILTGQLTWEYGHVAAAEHYEARHENKKAAVEYQALINQYPLVVSGYLRLARVYQAMGLRVDAERVYRQSLEVEKTSHAFRMLGKMANNDRRFTEAMTFFSNAIPLAANIDEQCEDRYNLALVFINAGMPSRGVEELRQLLALNRNYAPALRLLQQLGGGASSR